jgi:WhiB family transcriptional regulator, redox-sensing transcriptional regulator
VDAHELLRVVEAVECNRDAELAELIDLVVPILRLLAAVHPGEAGPWRAHAACRGETKAVFPGQGGSSAKGLELCSRCTVRRECYSWIAEQPDQHGIAGGMTEADRRAQQVAVA